MRLLTLEQIIHTLNSCEGVTNVMIPELKDDYNREVCFNVFGQDYKIEWWNNISYLYLSYGLKLPFYVLRAANTWPMRTKMQLQFRAKDDEVVLIMPTAYYSDEERAKAFRLTTAW